jgi:UDP-N-acetylmuramate dehydrogenase
MVKFNPEDCNFSYRSSRFNSSDKGKYLITSVKFKLNKQNYGGKLYKDVEDYLKANQVSAGSDIPPEQIRRAVIDIRSRKLPDPKKVANTGSFFKNPVISEIEFTKLKGKAPDILNKPQGWNQPPFWRVDNNYKISAGWLVQESGFANYYDRNLNFGTWPRQNLVIFSKSNQPEYNNLKRLKQLIQESVKAKFGITLEQEPEEVLL